MKKLQLVLVGLCAIALTIGLMVLKRVREDGEQSPAACRTTERRRPVAGESVAAVRVEGGAPVASDSSAASTERKGAPAGHQQKLDEKLSQLTISPAVEAIIGLNVDKNSRDARRAGLKKLTRELSEDDAEALRTFLDFRHEDNTELPAMTFAGIKNDALVVLLAQTQVPDGLGSDLARIFQDEKHGEIWRDFCLQYFAQYYDQMSAAEATPEQESDEREEMALAYDVALKARDRRFAGTALMAVERLSREHAEFDREKVGETALEMALAEDTCIHSRITALRVCGEMGNTAVLPQARILAQTGETVPVRLAAIATVGDLGDESDLEFIESLRSSSDVRLQRVAEHALKTLRERLAALTKSLTGK